MKYWILKIIGILGLIASPIVLNATYDDVVTFDSIVARRTWHEGCIILLVLFLVITMAGFARSIAKIKAWIDFHTDFDDDQELDGYPKVKIFSFVKKIVAIVIVVAMIALSVMKNKVDFVTDNYSRIMFILVAVLFVLFVASIIVCLIMRIVPLYYDVAVVCAIIGIAIDSIFLYYGIARIYSAIASVPLYAVSALCVSTIFDEFITIDDIFDWICDDTYDEYYKKLCDKEKATKELSKNKQAKQKKIENKRVVKEQKKHSKKNKNKSKIIKNENLK